MRIAIWHNLPSGGGKRALYSHVKALKNKGYNLEAWTTDVSSDSYLPLSEIITEHKYPVGEELLKISRCSNPLRREKESTILMKRHSMRCASEIEQGGFDLVFANSCLINTVPFISLYSKIPAVLYLGEPDRRLFEAEADRNIWALPRHPFSLRGLNRYRRDLVNNYTARFRAREQTEAAHAYSGILVNSAFSRESVKRAYGTDSIVCYLGIDENEFTLPENIVKKSYLVGMGRISSAKNLEMAISIVSMIPEQNRPMLKWISNDPVYDYLEKIYRLASEKKVRFILMPDLDDNELKHVLNEAAVMICTSHLEPFGLAPLEANMCGTSVIAVAEGGYRESLVNGENGFLIHADDLTGMAKLAEKFCSDLRYSEEMGKRARAYAIAHWNYSKMSENIENALTSVPK